MCAHGLLAQLSFGGSALGMDPRGCPLPAAPVIDMPAVDVPALLAVDAHRASTGIKGPWRFGLEESTDISTDNAGVWSTHGDLRIWRVQVHCPEALGIGIIFSTFRVPEGGHVFLYNANGQVLGGFTAASNPGHTVLGVQPMQGSTITIEYQEPVRVEGQGLLTVGTVIHVYRGTPWAPQSKDDRDFGSSGPCNVNTICPEGDLWRPEIRSVARIFAGGGFCTGTLLNNCANDSIPYFLTANHCLGGGSPDTWVFLFNWDSPVCDPTENGPMDQTVSGSTQLAVNPGSDMLFLRLNSQPPAEFNVTYSGWDATGTPPDSSVCIHHPAGDIKKITHDNNTATQTNIDVGNGPADCWNTANYESGTTEPGSSGSALWNQDHRIIGQLYGGSASCQNNSDDYYGRMDVSYPFIAEWLGDCDTLDLLDPGVSNPVFSNNAAITSIANVAVNICNEPLIHPVVTLKNNGVGYLETVTISYGFDGGPVYDTLWTGELAPLQTANVTLLPIPVINGPQTLTAWTSLPNSVPDGNPVDDAFSLELVINSPGEPVTLNLVPDNFGTDITWELANDQGTVLYNGGPYANNSTTPVIREYCLGSGCYTITIADVFGDGICCSSGNGHYGITSAFGTHVESNGQYGFGETRTFCLEGVGLPEATSSLLSVYPNPTNGTLNIILPGMTKEGSTWQLHDLSGRLLDTGRMASGSVRTSVDLGRVADGSYLLHVFTGGERLVRTVVVRH